MDIFCILEDNITFFSFSFIIGAGFVTSRMTVVTTLMKMKRRVVPNIENVLRVSLGVVITSVSPVDGAVTMIMTVVINLMKKTVVNINAG